MAYIQFFGQNKKRKAPEIPTLNSSNGVKRKKKSKYPFTLSTAEILSGKTAQACVSMVLYLKNK